MRSLHTSSAFRRAALLALPTFLTIFFACSDDGVGPPATRAAGIAKLNGDVQVGVVGRALPDSLVVKVTDKAGKAVAGVPVLWEITAGGGQASGAAVTSSAGEAKASWTLGTVAGANALVVRAGAAPAIAFQATAEAGAPAELELVLDSLVLTTPGEAIQISAAVRDSFENVVAAPALTYALSDTMVARVNASGVVTAKATGEAVLTVSAASVQQTIPVRVRLAVTSVDVDVDAVTMNAVGDTVQLAAVARNAAGGAEAATIAWTSSNGNIASVTAAGEVVGHSAGTALIVASAGGFADTATIEVRQVLASVSASAVEATITAGDSAVITITAADSNGVAVAAASVEWASGDSAVASVSPNGVVRGAKAGSAEITATVTAPASPTLDVTVDVSVLPAAPTGVVMVWGDGQGATIGGRLADSLVVNVTDPFGNAVPHQMVRWSVVAGGGSVSADSTETDAIGAASVIWTLGMTPGENTLTASAGTGSVTFTASAAQAVTPAGGSVSAPENAATVTVPANAVPVTTPITIAPASVFPPDENLVENTVFDFGPSGTQFAEPVTITLKFDPATLPAGTLAEELFIVLGENGGWTLIGNSVADLDAGIITGQITHFSPVGMIRSESTLELLTDSAELSVGQTIDINAQLRGRAPYDTITTIVNPEQWETSDESIATVDTAGVVTAVGAGITTITATHGAGRTATAKVVVTEPTAEMLEIISGDGGTFPAGDEAPDSLVVRALDAEGAPVAGVIVTWHATAGGGSVSPVSSTTDANGNAATQLTLGAATADNVVQARVEGADTAFFTVRGETVEIDSVAAHSDATLSAIVDTNVTEDPAVIVLDQFGRPMAGVDVEFVITAGGGSVTGPNDETDADGIATVGAWKLGSTAGENTLEARIEGQVPVVFTATGTVGAVARLVLTGAATQVAGELNVVTITAMDEFGNTVEAYEGPKNLTFSGAIAAPRGDEPTVTDRNGAAIDFGDVATILFTNGVATTSMALYSVESVTLSTTDDDISAAGADQLTVAVEHAALNDFALVLAPNQINTEAFTGTNTLTARDLYHNVVTSFDAASDGVTFTTTLAGTVSGLDTGNDDELEETLSFTNGVADLTGELTYTGTIGTGTFTATSASGKSGTSGNVSVVPGAATQLFIVTAPSAVANSGAPFAQQPVVRLRDASSNDVLTAGVAVEASLNGGGTLDGTTSIVTDANGIATFTDLGISGIIGNRTLSFTSGTLPVVTSTTIDLQPGTATQFSVETQPADTVQNAIAFAVQPVVQLRDAAGNASPMDSIAVTVSIASGGDVLGGTLTVNSDAAGLVTFTDLVITGTIGARTLTFSATDVTSAVSDPVLVIPGTPTKITITTQPSDSVANDVVFPRQPVLQLRDVSDNAVPEAGVEVVASIMSGDGALGGDNAVDTDASGTATFTDLKITGVIGDRTLAFTSTDLGGATSGTVTVIPGAATQLAIVTEPSADARIGLPFDPQPVIQLRDISGNDAPESNVDVRASILTGGGVLQGDTIIQTNASGTATFTDLAIIGTIGDRELVFASGSLVSATSDTIALTFGPAAQVVITTEPSTTAQSAELLAQQPVVQLRDASGNDADTAGVVITATLIGGGTLNGDATIATDANGVATFTDLGIEGIIGDRSLEFSAGALVPDTSATIDLQAGAATRLVLTGSASQTAGSTQNVIVTATDGAGNTATTYTGDRTLTFSGADAAPSGKQPTAEDNDGRGINFGTGTQVTFVNGVRPVFVGLYEADSATVAVTDGTLSSTGDDRLSVVVTHAALNDFALALATPQVNGTAFTGTNTLTARDLYHNPVLSFDAAADNVTLTTPLTGVVSGLGSGANAVLNQAADFTNGIADLAGALTYTGTAGVDTFTATSASGKSGKSGDIEIEPGAATKVVLTTEPSAIAQSGAALAQQPVAKLRDQSDNDVPSAGVIVTAAIASGGGTLGGDNTIATDASGTATFTDLEISGIIGDRTLSFSAPSLAADTSGTIDLQAGAAAKLTLESSVPDTVTNAVVFSTQPVVQLRDDAGNAVHTEGVAVTVGFHEGNGLFGGDRVVETDADGMATYIDLKITGTVGERVLSFEAASLTEVMDTVEVIAGAATQVVLTTEPTDTVQNARSFPTMPVAQLRDVSGNDVAQAGVAVEVVIASGGAALEGDTIIVTNAAGRAAFTDLAFRGTVGERVLNYNAAGLSSAVDTMQLVAGLASSLKIQQSPSLAVNVGVTFPQQPIIQIIDISGNPVPEEGVEIEGRIFSGGGQLLGDTIVATDANGTATYTGLNIVGLVGNLRELRFESESLSSPVTQYITVSAGPATQLVLTTQPSTTARSGTALAQQPVVQLRDVSGNTVSEAGVSVTARLIGGGELFGDSIIDTDSNGAATFTDLGIAGLVGNRTLEFVAADLAPDTSNAIDVQAGPAAKLGLTTLPSDTIQNNVVLTRQPVVQVQDASGNPVAMADVAITATHATPGGLLSGDRIIDTDENGTVTYTDLILKGPVGTYVLSFDANFLTGTSSEVEVIAGAAAQLTITTQPSASAQAGVDFPQQPVVQVSDVSGNAVAAENVDVTVAIATGADTLRGTKTVQTNASGVATFAGLDISGTVGDRTLEFAADGLAPDTSNTVAVTYGLATHLVLTTQPSATAGGSSAFAQQPVVELRDASGNTVPTDDVMVTASIASGGGALGGDSTIATVDGVATFTDLEITGALGDHTIEFSAAGLTPDTSDVVDITVGPPARLAYIGIIPDTVVAGEEFSFQVAIQDEAGNTVPDATDEVIIAGDEAANAVNGVATFSGLQTPQAGTLTLEATSGSLIPDTTVLVVTHAAASKLAFTTHPVTTTAGDTIPRIAVTVQDDFGNTVTSSTAQITLNRQNPAEGGPLTGDSVNSAVDGVATFSGLTIEKAISNYALAATSSNPTFLTSAMSDFFNITHAPLDNFLVEAEAGGDIADQVAGTPVNVKVTARDEFANVATSYTSAVTFTTTPADGLSAGGTSATFDAGVLSSHALTFDEGGTFTVTATGGGKAGTSNSFQVLAPPTAVNDGPSAASSPGDAYHAFYSTSGSPQTFSLAAAGVLSNDNLGFPAATITSFGADSLGGSVTTYAAGSTVSPLPGTGRTTGSLRVSADGSITFTPPDGFTGNYVFRYRLTNARGTSDGRVTIAVGVRPQAVADDYSAAHGNLLGNVPINTAVSSDFSVLDNDIGDGLQLFLHSGATGGAGLIEIDGTFEFRPTAGYEGAASMKYQVYNGFGFSDTVAVTMTIDDVVWFIDAAAGAGGNGRADQPFNCFVGAGCFSAITTDTVADKIFVYTGSYTGGQALLANQHLVGQGATGASFASVMAVTWPADAGAQPTIGGIKPTITAAAGDTTIVLGSNNTIRGLTFGNVGSAGTALHGNGFGTLTHSDVLFSTDGRAMNMTNGTLTGTFLGVTSSGGANNIALSNISGTVDFGSGALSGAGNTAVSVSGGGASFEYDGTISKASAGSLVTITGKTGGTVTLNGNLSCTSSCTGISVTGNTAGTVHFAGATKTLNSANTASVAFTGNSGNTTLRFSNGGLAITSGSATGINASNTSAANATLLVEGSNNTITSTTGTALKVENTTIGAAGLTFQSISSNGAANGILLNSTGTAGLTINGTGSNDSGGTIQTSTGDGISLNSTGPVSLTQMRIASSTGSHIDANGVNGLTLNSVETDLSTDHGIRGSNVTGFVVTGSTFDRGGAGNGSSGKHGIFMTNLKGTSSVKSSTFKRSNTIQFYVTNTSATVAAPAASQDVLTLSGNTWNEHTGAFGGDHFSLLADANSNMKLIVDATSGENKTGGLLPAGSNEGGNAYQIAATAGGKVESSITGVDAMNVTSGVNVAASTGGINIYDVFGNKTANGTGFASHGIMALNLACINSTCTGKFRDNTISHTAPANVNAINLIQEGTGTNTVLVENNVVSGSFQHGIKYQSRQPLGGTGFGHVTIRNNTLTQSSNLGLDVINVEAGGSGGGHSNTTCLNMSGNSATIAPGGTNAYRIRAWTGTTMNLQNFTGSGASSTDLQNWITSVKANSGTPVTAQNSGGTFQAAPGNCNTP